MLTRYSFISLTIALIFIFAAYFTKVWPMLGGHPYWSQSATYIGAAIGVSGFFLVALLTRGQRITLKHVAIALAAIIVIAFITTTLGKREFVGSYAENHLAGRIWYYGFIALIAAFLTSLAVGIKALLTRNR